MVALAPCPSCQWGDHEGHVAAWRPAPPGVLGGFYCDCSGDCVDKMSETLINLFAKADDCEPEDLGDKWKLGCFIWDKSPDE